MIAAAGRAAVQAWADEIEGVDPHRLPSGAVDRLRALLLQAMGYLADGFHDGR